MTIVRIVLSLGFLGGCALDGYPAPLSISEEIIVKVEESGRVSEDRRSIIQPDITIVPPEHRETVIQRYREIAVRKTSTQLGVTSIHPMDADLYLLRLGDDFTIKRMMQDYRAYDSMTSWGYVQTAFERSKQPKLIPYLAEDFSSKEDPSKGVTVEPRPGTGEFAVAVPPRSIFSGVTVTRIIEKSPAFSPEMKAWAHQAFALRLESPERFRRLMRAWWKVNKTAFDSEDYQTVKPVAEQDVGSSIPPMTEAKAELPVPQAGLPASPVASTPLSQSSPSIQKRNFPKWPWAVGFAILAVVALLLSKRRA